MSLILDALKKSEAERRLGRAPDLMSPMPVPHRRPGRMIWFSIAVVVLSASLVAVFWWWRLASNAVPVAVPSPPIAGNTASPPATSAQPSATSATADIEADQVDLRPRVDSQVASPRQTDATRTPMPAPAPIVEQTELPSDPRFDSIEREALPTTPPATSQPAATDAMRTPHPVETIESDAPTEADQTPREDAPPEIDDLPRLDQLSLDERNALPPLKLSMHVYAAQTTDRFVLIDGRRYREGEKISSSLQILEIRRDGVVLDLSGKSFLLLRP